MSQPRTSPCAVLAALLVYACASWALPAEPPTVLAVRVTCLDRSASEMDNAVATPLNRALGQIRGLVRLESTAVDEQCRIIATFDPKIDPPAARRDFRAAIDGAAALLPKDGTPVLRLLSGDTERLPTFWAAFTSPTATRWALSDITQNVAGKLNVSGVDDVSLFGRSTMKILVDLDPERMTALGVAPADVARTVNDAPKPGASPGDPKSVEAYGDTVVKVVNGTSVRLRDVARLSYPTQARGFALCDGAVAALVGCTLDTEYGGAADAADAVRKELSKLSQALPQATRLQVSIDLVRDRGLLIEVRPPPEARPESYRQTADRLGALVRAAAPRSTCVVFWPGGCEPMRVLVHGDDLDFAAPAWGKLAASLPGIDVRSSEVGGAAGVRPFPVRVALVGPEPERLRQWAEAVKARLDSDDVARGVVLFPGPGLRHAACEIDRDRAAQLGVKVADIETFTAMIPSRRANGGAGEAAAGSDADRPGSLTDFLAAMSVRSARGGAVPLSAVTKIVTATEPEAVFRYGQLPAIRLTANPPPGTPPAAATARCLTIIATEGKRLKIPSEYMAVDLDTRE